MLMAAPLVENKQTVQNLGPPPLQDGGGGQWAGIEGGQPGHEEGACPSPRHAQGPSSAGRPFTLTAVSLDHEQEW